MIQSDKERMRVVGETSPSHSQPNGAAQRDRQRKSFQHNFGILLLLIQKSSQPRISTATHRKLLSGRQHDDILILTIGLDFRDLLQIHDVRTMNPKKALRIKRSLQT